mmetsp:Transcript_165622/g.531631  ORF Transcript_165622/g.531631 Transcript_165622/m.531631 type:complete len:452 (-) Transcript_165622:2489-3844(-)
MPSAPLAAAPEGIRRIRALQPRHVQRSPLALPARGRDAGAGRQEVEGGVDGVAQVLAGAAAVPLGAHKRAALAEEGVARRVRAELRLLAAGGVRPGGRRRVDGVRRAVQIVQGTQVPGSGRQAESLRQEGLHRKEAQRMLQSLLLPGGKGPWATDVVRLRQGLQGAVRGAVRVHGIVLQLMQQGGPRDESELLVRKHDPSRNPSHADLRGGGPAPQHDVKVGPQQLQRGQVCSGDVARLSRFLDGGLRGKRRPVQDRLVQRLATRPPMQRALQRAAAQRLCQGILEGLEAEELEPEEGPELRQNEDELVHGRQLLPDGGDDLEGPRPDDAGGVDQQRRDLRGDGLQALAPQHPLPHQHRQAGEGRLQHALLLVLERLLVARPDDALRGDLANLLRQEGGLLAEGRTHLPRRVVHEGDQKWQEEVESALSAEAVCQGAHAPQQGDLDIPAHG